MLDLMLNNNHLHTVNNFSLANYNYEQIIDAHIEQSK